MQFQTWLNTVKPRYLMKIVGTKLDNSDYERFADFCLKEELTKSEVLRDLIKKFVNNRDQLLPEQNTSHTSKPIPNKTAQYKVVLYPDMPKGQDQFNTVSYDSGKTWYDDKGNLIK